MSTTRLFPLLLMASLALLTLWLDHQVRVEGGDHPSLRRHDPDYMVTNFTTTTYNSDGHAVTTLAAAQMQHYPDDDSTDVTAPRLVQSKPAAPRFTVQADRGKISREGDEIFLYDHVVLVRDADAKEPPAKMTTSFLHMLRDKALLRTDREVLFEQEGRSLTGRGMEYHTDTRELFLKNDVRARFEARVDPKKAP